MRRLALAAVPLLIIGCRERTELRVLAASSLTEAVSAAAAQFEKERGIHVSPSFSSTAVLAHQISSGANADVFISADEEWMGRLEQEGRIDVATRRDLCANRLVLIARKAPASFAWTDLLKARRIALAAPDYVPAGIYARQALENLGLWSALKPKVLSAMDVRAALAYVERGEADYGVVYATDAAIAPDVRVVREFPEDSHAPIRYPGAVLAKSARKPQAKEFLDYLSARKDLWRKYGFIPL